MALSLREISTWHVFSDNVWESTHLRNISHVFTTLLEITDEESFGDFMITEDQDLISILVICEELAGITSNIKLNDYFSWNVDIEEMLKTKIENTRLEWFHNMFESKEFVKPEEIEFKEGSRINNYLQSRGLEMKKLKSDVSKEIESLYGFSFEDLHTFRDEIISISETYARINASKRLRKKHELYEKTTNVYSVLILALSIWFIGDTDTSQYNLYATKILLILSLSLTFFTMYINAKNYKERASQFETNYQNLDILLNKIDRIESEEIEIKSDLLKELHREYEKLLLEKENHNDIDYMTSNDHLMRKFKVEIFTFKLKTALITALVVLHPLLLLGFILLSRFLINKI